MNEKDRKNIEKKPRGNPSKLVPANKRSLREASENGKKGGEKSGEVRRERRAMRDDLNALLSASVKTEKNGENTAQRQGLAMLVSDFLDPNISPLERLKMFIEFRDTLGEKPVEKIETSDITPKPIKIDFSLQNSDCPIPDD